MHSQLAKELLNSKLLEITTHAGWRQSIAVCASADPTDTTTQIGEREMASRGLSRNATLARNLQTALNRVADGSYGICIDCEEPIAPKRLAAVAWTCRCLACQTDFEAGGIRDEHLATCHPSDRA